MALKASNWCERFQISWTDDARETCEWATDDTCRLKIMDGGVILLRNKDGNPHAPDLVCGPQTWTRIVTPAFGPTTVSHESKWCNKYFVWLAGEDGPYQLTADQYRLKIMDGGVLLFENMPGKESEGFVLIAPHAWTRIKTSFDFSK